MCTMTFNSRVLVFVAAIVSPLSAGAASTNSESAALRSAAALLPISTVGYVEVTSPPKLLATVLDHPLRDRIESSPQFRELFESQDYRQFQMVLRVVEERLDLTWRPAVETLTGGGIYVAIDAESQGVALLVRSNDEQLLANTRDTFVQMIRADARDKGRPNPIRSVKYRGLEAYRAGAARLAVFGPWLVVTNSSELGRKILDNHLDRGSNTLAENAQFQQAVARKPASPTTWAYVDVAAIRTARVADALLGGDSNDPGGELILGGVLNTLHKTSYATAALSVDGDGIRLALVMPHSPAWTPEERSFFFGPNQRGAAPPPIDLPDTLVTIGAYRDISRMWLHGPELFDDAANAALAKANSDLSTLFGGRAFAEEILGALDGGMQFIASRQNFAAVDSPTPSVKLPAFAAVGRLKDPQASPRPLRIAFQTAIGFVNLTRAETGNPPLEIDTDRHDGIMIMSASYAPDDMPGTTDGEPGILAAAPLHFNFSPTIAFVDNRLVLSSTRQLAKQLAERLRARQETETAATLDAGSVTNTSIRVNVAALRTVLTENRDHLVAQNMLEKGHDRLAAEGEIDGLLMLLEWFQRADAKLIVSDDEMKLKIAVTVAGNP